MNKFKRILIVFTLMFTLFSIFTGAQVIAVSNSNDVKVNNKIHIDQLGYRTNDKKVVVISGKGGVFEVIDSKTQKAVYSGKAQTKVDDTTGASGDIVYYGDFSSIKKAGVYYIKVPGVGKSYSFKISDDVYNNVKDTTLKGLYYQRCGIELNKKYAGQWVHEACHLSAGQINGTNKMLNGNGGWHDAGDYGKYTIGAAKTAADLLLAYDFYPKKFNDKSNIPESGNKVPDVLDESRYGINWMLKMQDKSTGGVYHKLTAAGFPDITTMPDTDIADLYFSPISSTATGDFAAITALAARIYKPFDKAFSAKCLAASEKAWAWLTKHKNPVLFHNPAEISTGEYGDSRDSDERFWAAAELYRTTGKKTYNDYIKNIKDRSAMLGDIGWQSVGGYGCIAYVFTDKNKTDNSIRSKIINEMIKTADAMVTTSNSDGYKTSLKSGEYYWGSNGVIMNKAMQLIIANSIKSNIKYLQAAQDDLHYVLGRNTMDKTYITGIGANSVKNPHHRPSVGDGITAPVPGLVAGGPNSRLEDDLAKSKLTGLAPAKCYIDDVSSYSTNEIDTYWNSPTVFVSAYFSK